MNYFLIILIVLYTIQIQNGYCHKIKHISSLEKQSMYWKLDGIQDLKRHLIKVENKKRAKNIILFIGDGMGISTLTAARIYKNQYNYHSKMPDEKLYFEHFPYNGLIDTSGVDVYVSDSANTATAIMTGIKTNMETVAVSPKIKHENCSNYDEKTDNLESIGDMFYKQNQSVGLVTNTVITHATPSSLYAHSPSRNWQASVPNECKDKVKDIAQQFVDKATNIRVALGGGRNNFLNKQKLKTSKRTDSKDLLNEWILKMNGKKAKYVDKRQDLLNLNITDYDHVLGLFNDNHMNYDINRNSEEPTLIEMTIAAIKILKKDPNGFFLLVEGGRIDFAHHENKAQIALIETLRFEKAIEEATNLVNLEETLILVTADHSHVFTIGSYDHRENDITQPNKVFYGNELDKKGHTSLLYSNGPGWKSPRENITKDQVLLENYQYHSGVPFEDETHGGEDVAVYGIGPWSHLLIGQHHQSYLGHLMMMASCTGNQDEYGDMMEHC